MDAKGDRRSARWGVAGLAAALLTLAAPSGAAAVPGEALVADINAFGGTGGVIRVDPVTGARTALSANGMPAGGPDFSAPYGIALEADGRILVSDFASGGTGALIRVDPTTGARSLVSANGAPPGAPDFANPRGVALEPDGRILIADGNFGTTGAVIRVDSATGARTLVSANGTPGGGPDFTAPRGIAVEADGRILVADEQTAGGTGAVIRVDPVTGVRTLVSANGMPAGGPDFGDPEGIALEADGRILIGDESVNRVIRVDPVTGARTLVSANGIPAGGPNFSAPAGTALEADGHILTANFGSPAAVIRVDPVTGARTLVSANGMPAGGPDFSSPFTLAVQPPEAALASSKAKLKGKAVKPEVACAAGFAACNGGIDLETAKPVKLRGALAAKKQIVDLGDASFSIAAGLTQKLKLKVPRKGRKLFERKRKVKANATLVLPGAPLQSSTTTEQIKLKKKKR